MSEQPNRPQAELPTSDVLRILFERAPEIITITNASGDQLMVNATGLQIFGFDESYRRPDEPWLMVHPDDRVRITAHRLEREEQRRTGVPVTNPPIRYRVRTAAGDWRWLETVSADMEDVPEVGGRVAFSRDVTDAEERAQALLESQARLSALIANLGNGAFIDDGDGIVLLANERVGPLFGVDVALESIIGRPSSAVLAVLGERVLDRPDFRSLVQASAAEPGVHAAEIATVAGRHIAVEVVPITSGSAHYGRLWLFEDATVRHLEAQQARMRLQLEQQARVAAELQAQQLAEYDELRNEFVRTVSHELRTPLTSIASATELLLSDPEPLPMSVIDRLGIVMRNANRLRDMVEDLLLVGRLDAGMLTLDRQSVHVASLIRDVVTEWEPIAVARQITVRCHAEEAVTAWADARRLRQIVGNLIDNALKFTPVGSAVRIDARTEAFGTRIVVRDQGPGIPVDQRDVVFERFVRTELAERSATPGSGLGLAIVKGLVDLHGGTVTVDDADADGGGAVVVVWLPSGAT